MDLAVGRGIREVCMACKSCAREEAGIRSALKGIDGEVERRWPISWRTLDGLACNISEKQELSAPIGSNPVVCFGVFCLRSTLLLTQAAPMIADFVEVI